MVNMKVLNFSELHEGLQVKDRHGNKSVIKKCQDDKNILVRFVDGTEGYGFYCLDSSCKHYNPLFKRNESL